MGKIFVQKKSLQATISEEQEEEDSQFGSRFLIYEVLKIKS